MTAERKLTDEDIAAIKRMARDYKSLAERWNEAPPYSQSLANLHATYKAREHELGDLAEKGLFERLSAYLDAREQDEALHRLSREALQALFDAYCNTMRSEFDFPGRPWTPERDNDQDALAARDALAALDARLGAAHE